MEPPPEGGGFLSALKNYSENLCLTMGVLSHKIEEKKGDVLMKHTKWIALLLAALLLAGCTAGPDETTQPAGQETTAPVTTAPAETEETVPPTELTAEGVNMLTLRKFVASPFIAVLDERTVAFLTTEYDRKREITVSHLMTLDLYTDTVLGETTLDFAVSFPVQSHLPGVLPVFDVSGDRWLVLDRKLDTVNTFACEESGGVFSPDMTEYYYVVAQRLCRMELATGETALLETELGLPVDSIADYRMEDDVLLVNVHTQYYLTDLCMGAVEAATGKLLALSDAGEAFFLTSDGVMLQHSELVNNSDLIRGGWNGETARKLTDALPRSTEKRSWCVPMSDYQILLGYDAKNAYNLSSFLLCRFRDGYETCEIAGLTGKMEPSKVVSLPGGNLLAVDYARRGTKIALIHPELLEFEQTREAEEYTLEIVDAAIPESYAEQSAYVEVPGELMEVRTAADEMEQRYDITILMSNQCDSIIEQCGFELQPSDQADLENEAKLLSAALKDLENSLSLYPDAFFTQFRNEADERGILVLLVANIAVDVADDNVDVLGVTYDMGDWYPIAVDVTTRDLPATYCHEIWHAMENKIMDEDPMLLNDVRWGELNPDGFSYKGAVEGYYNDTEYTYLESGAGKDSFFVDTYGKTSYQEDRARIMEYIMTSDYTAKYLMEAPVLHEKMAMMIRAVRSVFDTTGWEEVLWERFHP